MLLKRLRAGWRDSWELFECRFARRSLLLLALCLIAALLSSSGALHAPLMRLMGSAEALIRQYPTIGPLVFVGFAAVSAVFAFFSSAMLVPLAVLTWGSINAIAMLWAGWTIGGMASYWLARHFGRRALEWLGVRGVLTRIEHWVHPDAPFGLVLLLQLALPSEVPAYLLGLLCYPARKYLCALALAELPYALATVFLGQGLVTQRSGLVLAVGVLVSFLSLAALHVLRLEQRRKNDRTVHGPGGTNPSVCI